MGLSTESTGNGGGPLQPYYIEKVRISKVQDFSGEYFDWMQKQYDAPDIAIKAFLNIGRDFEPELDIFGNFSKDEEGRVEGWGGAFKVAEFLKKALGRDVELTDDNRIPTAILEELQGKEILYLRYAYKKDQEGKVKFSTYGRIESAEGDLEEKKEQLFATFDNDVTEGWVKNYRPEVLEKNQDKKMSTAGVGATEEPFEPDDDLPF